MIHWGKDCTKKIMQVEEAYKKELKRTNVDFLHMLTTYKLQIQALNKELNDLKSEHSTYNNKKEEIISPKEYVISNAFNDMKQSLINTKMPMKTRRATKPNKQHEQPDIRS